MPSHHTPDFTLTKGVFALNDLMAHLTLDYMDMKTKKIISTI
jgi:hypothetical protein